MAEEKAQEPKPQTPAPSSGQKPTLFIILAVFNMLVVGAVGAMIYMGKKADEKSEGLDAIQRGEQQARDFERDNPQFIGELIPLETFLVNLAGSRGQKLVKINMELEVNSFEVQTEIDVLKPKIRDMIILIVSSKSYEQVSTSEGKDELRREIRDKVNLFLTKGQINRVYFTEFIYN